MCVRVCMCVRVRMCGPEGRRYAAPLTLPPRSDPRCPDLLQATLVHGMHLGAVGPGRGERLAQGRGVSGKPPAGDRPTTSGSCPRAVPASPPSPRRQRRAGVAVSPSPRSRGRSGTVGPCEGPTLLSGETKAEGRAERGTLPRVVGCRGGPEPHRLSQRPGPPWSLRSSPPPPKAPPRPPAPRSMSL